MPLEKILEKIIQDAEEEKARILKEAKDRAEEIIRQGRAEADKIREEILKQGKENAEKIKERITALAYLDSRKRVLEEKQKIIDAVYEEVEGRIRNLPLDEYRALLKRIMVESCQTGEELVVPGKKEIGKINERFLEEVNKELQRIGKKGKLKLSGESRDIQDGFILKSGKVEVNNSWQNIFRALREKTEDDVVRLLFPGQP